MSQKERCEEAIDEIEEAARCLELDDLDEESLDRQSGILVRELGILLETEEFFFIGSLRSIGDSCTNMVVKEAIMAIANEVARRRVIA